MSSGKKIRMSRFRYEGSTKGLIVPMDHGLTIGAVPGIRNNSEVSTWIGHSAVCGVIAHKGMVERLAEGGLLGRSGVMVHLNGMSLLASDPDTKMMLTSISSAVRLGADAVSLQVNFDGSNDSHNLALLGSVVDQAQRYGLPVLTMLYDKVHSPDQKVVTKRLKHLIRIAVELGTDAIKLAPPSDLALIPELIEGTIDHTAIYFAGGSLDTDDSIFNLAQQVVESGASGLCVGRNVFQRPNPALFLDELELILRDGTEFSVPRPHFRTPGTPLSGRREAHGTV